MQSVMRGRYTNIFIQIQICILCISLQSATSSPAVVPFFSLFYQQMISTWQIINCNHNKDYMHVIKYIFEHVSAASVMNDRACHPVSHHQWRRNYSEAVFAGYL